MKVTFRTHSISPGDHRSSRGSGPAVPDEVLATTGLGGSARQMSASVFHPSSGGPDCVAEDAVRSETVSPGRISLQFAICREIFRNYRESQSVPCQNFLMISRGSYEFSLAQGAGRGFEYCREGFGNCREEQRGIANGGRVWRAWEAGA